MTCTIRPTMLATGRVLHELYFAGHTEEPDLTQRCLNGMVAKPQPVIHKPDGSWECELIPLDSGLAGTPLLWLSAWESEYCVDWCPIQVMLGQFRVIVHVGTSGGNTFTKIGFVKT